MEQNNDEKEILETLFVREEDLIKRLKNLVELSQGLFSIVEETGEVFIEDPTGLNNADKIFIFLLGNYFASKYGLKNKHMSTSELAHKLSVPITTIPAPMKNLLRGKIVIKSEKGSYHINFDNYKKIKERLIEIREKTGRKKENG